MLCFISMISTSVRTQLPFTGAELLLPTSVCPTARPGPAVAFSSPESRGVPCAQPALPSLLQRPVLSTGYFSSPPPSVRREGAAVGPPGILHVQVAGAYGRPRKLLRSCRKPRDSRRISTCPAQPLPGPRLILRVSAPLGLLHLFHRFLFSSAQCLHHSLCSKFCNLEL